ncbi:hypothetical protein V3C99_006115 [Haemonchus contortus]
MCPAGAGAGDGISARGTLRGPSAVRIVLAGFAVLMELLGSLEVSIDTLLAVWQLNVTGSAGTWRQCAENGLFRSTHIAVEERRPCLSYHFLHFEWVVLSASFQDYVRRPPETSKLAGSTTNEPSVPFCWCSNDRELHRL